MINRKIPAPYAWDKRESLCRLRTCYLD